MSVGARSGTICPVFVHMSKSVNTEKNASIIALTESITRDVNIIMAKTTIDASWMTKRYVARVHCACHLKEAGGNEALWVSMTYYSTI